MAKQVVGAFCIYAPEELAYAATHAMVGFAEAQTSQSLMPKQSYPETSAH